MASFASYPIRRFCRGCMSNAGLVRLDEVEIKHPSGHVFRASQLFLGLAGIDKFFEPGPQMICDTCLAALVTALNFRWRARHSDDAIKNFCKFEQDPNQTSSPTEATIHFQHAVVVASGSSEVQEGVERKQLETAGKFRPIDQHSGNAFIHDEHDLPKTETSSPTLYDEASGTSELHEGFEHKHLVTNDFFVLLPEPNQTGPSSQTDATTQVQNAFDEACGTSEPDEVIETMFYFRSTDRRSDDAIINLRLLETPDTTETSSPTAATTQVQHADVEASGTFALHDYYEQVSSSDSTYSTDSLEEPNLELVTVNPPNERPDSRVQLLCYVCYAISTEHFYVRFVNELDDLYLVNRTLGNIDLEPLPDDQYQNAVRCVVRSHTDGLLYRAEIKTVYKNGYIKVIFTDFGFNEDVDEACKFPENLTFPKLAVCCTLVRPEGTVWMKKADRIFRRMAKNSDTDFAIEFLKDDEFSIVNLFCQGVNIIHYLVETKPQERKKLEIISETTENECGMEDNETTIDVDGNKNVVVELIAEGGLSEFGEVTEELNETCKLQGPAEIQEPSVEDDESNIPSDWYDTDSEDNDNGQSIGYDDDTVSVEHEFAIFDEFTSTLSNLELTSPHVTEEVDEANIPPRRVEKKESTVEIESAGIVCAGVTSTGLAEEAGCYSNTENADANEASSHVEKQEPLDEIKPLNTSNSTESDDVFASLAEVPTGLPNLELRALDASEELASVPAEMLEPTVKPGYKDSCETVNDGQKFSSKHDANNNQVCDDALVCYEETGEQNTVASRPIVLQQPSEDESTNLPNMTEEENQFKAASDAVDDDLEDFSNILQQHYPMTPNRLRLPKLNGYSSPLAGVHEEPGDAVFKSIAPQKTPKWPDNMSDDRLVYLTCIKDPGEFYIHFPSKSAAYEAMMKRIRTVAPYRQRLVRFSKGTLCFFYNLGDWHRAMIMNEERGVLKVQSIDLGRTDYVKKWNRKSLYEIHEDFANIEMFAKRCSLFAVPHGGNWCDAAKAMFGCLENYFCEARAMEVSGDGSRYFTDLIFNSTNVADTLVLNGFGLRLVKVPDVNAMQLPNITCNRVRIASFTAINNFQVMFMNPSLISYISNAMLYHAHNFVPLADAPRPNLIVATWYQGHFYRAIVLSKANAEGGFHVELIDFGLTVVSYEFRKLPEVLVNLPALVIRCRLANETGMRWTVPKAERFRVLCLSQNWLDIRVIDADERVYIVQLNMYGRAISEIVEAEFTPIPNQVVSNQPVFPFMPVMVRCNQRLK